MEHFLARYEQNGIPRSHRFSKAQFTTEQADAWLKNKGVQNFLFFFEPNPIEELDENTLLMTGEIGFDITLSRLLPILKSSKKIAINSPGGSLYETYAIMDAASEMGVSPNFIGMGIVASAATLLTLGKSATENTRFLIHNPWAFDAGDAASHEKTASKLRSETENVAKMYAKGSENNVKFFIDLMNEEKFITAKEAKAIGLINSVKHNNYVTKNQKKMENEEKIKKLEETMNRFQNAMNVFAEAFSGKPRNEEHEGDGDDTDPESPDVLKQKISDLEADLAAKDAKIKELEEKLGETSEENEEMSAKLQSLASVQTEVSNALAELKQIKSEFKVEARSTSFTSKQKEQNPKGLDKEEMAEIRRIYKSKK